ncbi:MAG: AbrB/MazE/SpoVT family DNA-binding domain-containing protein [Proteobacteria bacterium]|nr:AbrB/MazE/SpoVT family DNA-binding domain-containing protein [Pseudomonadota bacterium]
MKAIVAERGQVTIPKKIRERFGISAKTVLDFYEDEGRLIVIKFNERDPVANIRGSLHLGRTSDEILKELRDE